MADFRPIAPALQSEQSSASSAARKDHPSDTPGTSVGGTSGGGSGSGAGDGGGDGGRRGGPGRGPPGDANPRRRRLPGHVAVLACNECRRARAKCDGERPETCSRCAARGFDCIYEPHTKTHKDDLIKEMESIRAQHAGLQGNYSGLQEDTKHLQKHSEDQSIILDILTNNGHVEEVIRRLRSGEARDSVADWLHSRPELERYIQTISGSRQNILNVVSRVEDLYDIPGKSPSIDPSLRQWTKVTHSQVLIHHLFELYFTWVHPVHMLFGELDFLNGYNAGDETYCSRPLVSAICAMACHLLENPVPGVTDREISDRMKLREAFMDEARGSIEIGSELPMTSIQAFAVMYLVDLSSNKARRASAYLRCAAETLKSTSFGKRTEEVMELSQWGIHTLNTAWAGITFQKPFNPVSPRKNVFFNVEMLKDSVPAQWRYYRQPGDETHIPKRPSYAILTACHQAKLFRIVHDSINIYCGARGKVTAKDVISCYRRYLDWKERLPDQVRRTDEEAQPLPHVLALHIQYHAALTQLFVPLAECNYFPASDTVEIRNLIVNHARQGLSALEQSHRLYSCRYHMPLTTFCSLHLGEAILRYSSEPPNPDIIEFLMLTMKQNRAGFSICGPLQHMLRNSLERAHISMPKNFEEFMEPGVKYSVDDILDACTRLSYEQPTEQIVRWIDSSIADGWLEEWQDQVDQSHSPKRRSRTHSTGTRSMEITSLLND